MTPQNQLAIGSSYSFWRILSVGKNAKGRTVYLAGCPVCGEGVWKRPPQMERATRCQSCQKKRRLFIVK